MKNKICLINQPAGLGDILLCQKMAYYYIDKGYNILWPVNSRYNYLNEYIGNEKINFFQFLALVLNIENLSWSRSSRSSQSLQKIEKILFFNFLHPILKKLGIKTSFIPKNFQFLGPG